MKFQGILLLLLAGISASAQGYEKPVLPTWYLHAVAVNNDVVSIAFNEPFPVKTISLSTGVKLEYVEQGDPNGQPVILVHGFPDSWRSYQEVMPHLPQSLHVFAISMRGFGNSDRPAKGYFPKDFAADLAAFVKAFRLPPAVFVGHSMGATITQQVVLSYPELVRGIVLEGAFASFNDKKDVVDYKAVVDQLKDPLDTALAREFQQSTLVKPIAEEYFNTLLNESMKVKANVWKQTWEGFMIANYRKEIGKVKKPALLICGGKDSMGPLDDQEFLASTIKGAQLIYYKETGHSAHWEEPVRFADDVAKFVKSIK